MAMAAIKGGIFRRLDFESDLLGAGVYRLTNTAIINSDVAVAEIVALLEDAGCWLAVARVPADDEMAATALSVRGFRKIETLVTLEHRLESKPDTVAGEIATPDDAEGCAAVADNAFTMDRLHRDPEIPGEIADRVRHAWVLNNVRGRADRTFVERVGGTVVGFITCLTTENAAVIDLIAVAPAQQGKGIGRRLVRSALSHYAGKKPLMRVGTQGDNLVSLKLYHATGFHEVKRELTFHRIFGPAPKRPTITDQRSGV